MWNKLIKVWVMIMLFSKETIACLYSDLDLLLYEFDIDTLSLSLIVALRKKMGVV